MMIYQILTMFAVLVAAMQLSSHKSGRIVFFGDSITYEGDQSGGYIDLIRKQLRATANAEPLVVAAGISGNKVPDLQARLQKDVLSRNPDIVVIYIGINDVWHSTTALGGTPKDRYESGLRDIVARITSDGALVLLCTPSVIGEKHDGTNQLDTMLDQYAQISRDVARSFDVPVCDLRKAFLSYLKDHNPRNEQSGILTRDGAHLSAAGNQLVAKEILASLAGLN